MKTLTLLRHAKSDWSQPVSRDFDRPLNDKGRKAARLIGRELRAKGLAWDLVYASPAARVVETLARFADGYGRALEPEYDQLLYLASPEALLDKVQGVDDGVDRLLLVGHNPGLELLALLLVQEDPGTLRRDLLDKYPTAAVAEISLPVSSWAEVVEGCGTLTHFIRPRDLDPNLGPDE
jgi:phosphohistidine phosphatase